MCEPQFWFDRLIRMAIANGIAGNCPIRFHTGGDGNVFQQATHLFGVAVAPGALIHAWDRIMNRVTDVKRRDT